MTLYSFKTEAGGEIFSTSCITDPNGEKAATPAGIIFRTEGDDIYIYATNIWKQGYRINLVGDFKQAYADYLKEEH